jgi:hypothetical protein
LARASAYGQPLRSSVRRSMNDGWRNGRPPI